jgi:small subunit ribosomal protein S17
MTVTRNKRGRIWGTVVGDRMDKTITVRVERTYKHPKYGKYVRRHTRYHAHDEKNEAHVGDQVELMECRPLSKTKRFRLIRVTQRADAAAAAEGGAS